MCNIFLRGVAFGGDQTWRVCCGFYVVRNTLRAASDLLRAYVFDTAMQYRSLFNSPEVQVDPLAVWMSSQVMRKHIVC